jgi:RND family efflux transporter MFP subunit
MTVEDTRGFRLEVKVDETRVGAIDATKPVEVALQPAVVETASPSYAVVPGKIAEFARALDPGSHAFLVKIDLPESATLRSGMFGRARFAGAANRSLTVPASAVVRRGQIASVFVVGADNRAALRMVQVGAASETGAEVVAGLDAGERVVVNAPPALVDGTPVREVRR